MSKLFCTWPREGHIKLCFLSVNSNIFFLCSSSSTAMASPHRPSRAKSRLLASSLSLVFLAFFALICLCPAVSAQDDVKKSEYGTVIGIGMCTYLSQIPSNNTHQSLADLGTTYVLLVSVFTHCSSSFPLVIRVLGQFDRVITGISFLTSCTASNEVVGWKSLPMTRVTE